MIYTHTALVEIAARWLHQRCGVVITEMACSAPEQPDAIGWKGGLSYLVECKVSRADFLRDGKKFFRRTPDYGMGNFRYFIAPSKVIRPDEVPEGWGLLEPHGTVIRKLADAKHVQADVRRENELLCSALRRIITPGVIGVRCRVYQIMGEGEARAAVSCEPAGTVTP